MANELSPDQQRRLASLLSLSPEVDELALRFVAEGLQLYLVGGTVRDALLGRAHTDLDFATDAPPERTRGVLQPWADDVWMQGAAFGTVGCARGGLRVEITTFREEVYPADSRNPEVRYAPDILADLSRRDFTINAMAVRLPERSFVDPFGGIGDLAAGILRTPSGPALSFGDDPLRMLRAARFVSELKFKPSPDTLTAITEQRSRLGIVSRERIRDELSKLLLGSAPGVGLDVVVRTGLAAEFLPEIPALALAQDPVNRHKDVLRHTIAVVERAALMDAGAPDLTLRMAALLHDIGKPRTRAFGSQGVSFHHHEVVGAQMAEARLRGLRYPAKFVEAVAALVLLHLRVHTFRMGWTDSAVRRYARDAGPLLERLNRLIRADCTTRNPMRAKQLTTRIDDLESRIAVLAEQENLARIRPPLDGREVMAHLGIQPSPLVGKALAHLLEIRLDSGPLDKDEGYRLLEEWALSEGLEIAGEH
ncbi:MAG: CCA tRNA nucleotidyltransferase [Actinomycetota bacterium]